jgi:inosine-uridine nucleoside N-ribohydrolase
VNVAIDTSSGISAGRTACDIHGVTGAAPNADVAMDMDVPAFWDLMVEALATY